MAITNFQPEIWAAAVQEPFDKALVYAQPSVSNRQYEGMIQQMGDTVHVTSITAPTVNTYNKAADITIQDLTDSDTALLINQGDYFAFRVNDVDKVQAAGDFQSSALVQAGTALRDKLDKFVAALPYTNALTGNKLGRVTVVNGGTNKAGSGQTLAFDVLVSLRELLDAQSVPTDGRFAVVDPKFISGLLRDDRFVRVDASGTADGLRNGLIGRAIGMDILVSNNVRTVNQSDGSTGANQNDLVITAGVPGAMSVAQQITETEALREQGRFADIIRGLNIYGAKVFRPEGIATATATYAAGTG